MLFSNIVLGQEKNPFKKRAKELCARLEEYESFFKKTIADAKHCFDNEIENYKCKPKFFINTEREKSSIEMCNLFSGEQEKIDKCRKLKREKKHNEFENYIFNYLLGAFLPPSKLPFNVSPTCTYSNGVRRRDSDLNVYATFKGVNFDEKGLYRGGVIIRISGYEKKKSIEKGWADGISFYIAHEVEENGKYIRKSKTEPQDAVLMKIYFSSEVARY